MLCLSAENIENQYIYIYICITSPCEMQKSYLWSQHHSLMKVQRKKMRYDHQVTVLRVEYTQISNKIFHFVASQGFTSEA